MTLPNNTLVLVADGRKALFLRNQGDEQQIDLRTASHREREDRKDSDIKTDAAGAITTSASNLPASAIALTFSASSRAKRSSSCWWKSGSSIVS